MKGIKKIVIVWIIAICSFPLLIQAAEHPWDRKLPFQGGMIHYALSGMEEGTETLYIRDYGATTARYHNGKASMMGVTVEMKTIEITEPDWIYTYDLIEKTGSKSANPMKFMIEEFNALSATDKKKAMKNAEAMGAGFPGMSAFDANATEMLGYACDKVSAMGTTTLVIHDTNVPLKTEADTMGMKMTVTALNVKKGDVPNKYFSHPENIEAVYDQEESDMARSMAEQAVAMLVTGKMPESNTMMTAPQMRQGPSEDQEGMQQAMEMMKGLFGTKPQ